MGSGPQGLARKRAPFKAVGYGYAAITVGAEAGDVINVAVRLQNDRRKNSVVTRVMARAYLSDAATGVGITGVTVTGATAIGTNGTIINTPVTKKMWDILTDTSGRFDLNITNTGTEGLYLVIVFPDGSIQVSPIIQFA
jgi:hypothetical protein